MIPAFFMLYAVFMDHVSCRFISRLLCCFVLALFLTACAGKRFDTPEAKGYYASSAVQCVPYARQVSGIQIYGDAHTWWAQAKPPLIRRHYPVQGDVLVLARTNAMRYGHVAVVRKVMSNRDIMVTHSNWGNNRKNRRIIYESVRARDASANNDWSQIRFWNYETKAFGRPYAAMGFIGR